MNPDDTNPTTNTGATGGNNAGSVVPPALDFTSSDTTSLSMADSLASAADNLTSAGMAAKEPDNGSIGMSEIGASDPSAQMERPDEPLVPAAPVPGSIGSVTSGPAVATHDDASTAPVGGTAMTKPFGGTGVSGFGATSSFGAPAGVTGVAPAGFRAASTGTSMSNGAAGMGMAGASTGASAAGIGTAGVTMAGTGASGMNTAGAGASSTSVAGAGASGVSMPSAGATKEPYNPFAARMGSVSGSAQTSSMNVPAGSQPATEKFSAKLPNASTTKKPAMLTVILGILAAVSLIMAIVFAILWQNAEANKKVVYEPSGTPGDGTANQTVAMITCTKNYGPDEADIMAGLVDHNAAATVSFSNDQLGSITMLNKYIFADAAAAEAMRTYFDGTVVWYGSVAEASGVTAGPASLDITDTVATLSLSTAPEQLAGEYIALFGLTAGADGKVDTSREAIQANYAANGFVCVED